MVAVEEDPSWTRRPSCPPRNSATTPTPVVTSYRRRGGGDSSNWSPTAEGTAFMAAAPSAPAKATVPSEDTKEGILATEPQLLRHVAWHISRVLPSIAESHFSTQRAD